MKGSLRQRYYARSRMPCRVKYILRNNIGRAAYATTLAGSVKYLISIRCNWGVTRGTGNEHDEIVFLPDVAINIYKQMANLFFMKDQQARLTSRQYFWNVQGAIKID